jgi:hypothetical protein
MHSYTKIIAPLNEIHSIAERLYDVEKRSILHVRATKIKAVAMEARQWTMTREGERSALEKQIRVTSGTGPNQGRAGAGSE